jgi:hypothetical protein
MNTVKHKVAVACTNANGEADLVVTIVEVTEDQITLGEHYNAAEAQVESEGYEKPFICFDEHEQGNIKRATHELVDTTDCPMKEALTSLISDAQATGGIVEFTDGLSAPAADPAWTDLGATILKAQDALEKEGVELRLNINVVDFPSDEAEENL